MTKTQTRKANLPQTSAQSNAKSLNETASFEAYLENMFPNNNESEDEFAPPMFDDENDGMPLRLDVISQPGGVSDLTDDDWIRQDWIAYEKRAMNFAPLTKQQLQSIRLLTILRNSKASLSTYDKVMQWFLRSKVPFMSTKKPRADTTFRDKICSNSLKHGTIGTLATAS